jgi:hypothetical protein
MNKNETLSIGSELTSDISKVLQDNVLQKSGNCPAKSFYGNDTLTKLSPGMARAIQESIEVSFGK